MAAGMDSPFESSGLERSGRYLLIATWGDPAKWGEARYLIRGTPYEHYCTSLIPILLSMRDKDETRGVDLVIIVLDLSLIHI